MPNVARLARMAPKAKKIGRRLYRVDTGPGGANAGANSFLGKLGYMPIPWAKTAKADPFHPMNRGKRHYFTKAGWKKFGLPAYKAMRAEGVRLPLRHKRGGVLIDRWQALAGIGAAAFGLKARRRSKKRGRRL